MGKCPDWFSLMKAARAMHVPPWELMQQPMYWIEWSNDLDYAEAKAKTNKTKMHEVRSGMKA